MTVSTTNSTQSFAGGQSSLTFTFKTLPGYPEYIKLKAVLISSGAETELTYASGYTVSLNTDGVGGTITVSPTHSTLYRYVAYRKTSNKQESDYEDYNAFPADTVEGDYDRRTVVEQEMKEEIDRSLKIPLAGATFDSVIPYPVASRYLKINSDGDGFALDSLATTSTDYDGSMLAGADASKAATPEANDIYFATDTNIMYICWDDGTWTPMTTLYMPTGGTLAIKNSAETTVADIDETGNLDIAGNFTAAAQPGFNVTKTTTQGNIAINATVAVTWDSERFDNGGDFAANTFTAPVTGKYLLGVSLQCADLDSAATRYAVDIVTSNKTYSHTYDMDGFSGDVDFNFAASVIADMDAADTASITVYQTGGTQQTDITASSYFYGWLLG